ncbi:unnamed protein product [Somion occarium]|uniref:Uncharacterized protein n=1 Tax=Somion occarium TaxID=3059160 RepID=A0ABP1CS95_9APHY
MANMERKSKSGDNWTYDDLLSYNIRLEYQDFSAFFEATELPEPNLVDPEILTAADAWKTTTNDAYAVLHMMRLSHKSTTTENDPATTDFAFLLLRSLGYTKRDRLVRTRQPYGLIVAGENKIGNSDLTIVDEKNNVMLVFREDKRYRDVPSDIQLIAEGIAALATRNLRRRPFGLPLIANKIIPGILMRGSFPIFYKIAATSTLTEAIKRGDYPGKEAVVYVHIPVMPRPEKRADEGMIPLDNRKIILSYFEAFRKFV